MATTPTTQYWIRTDGSDANGGGFDPAGGSGTNYSDQASPQATWSQLTLVAGTLTDPLSGGLFTANMLYNLVNVPGQGYYLVTARTSGNVVTVTPCTGATTSFTIQPGKLGGALRNPSALSNGGTVSAPGTATPLAPGNQINWRASGSGSVGSPDYTQTGYAQYPSGDTTNGRISWVAYNGTPYFVGNGLAYYQVQFHSFIGGYFSFSGASNGSYSFFGQTGNCLWRNCTVDLNNYNVCGIGGTNGGGAGNSVLLEVTIVGGGTSSSHGFVAGNYGSIAKNCKFSGCGGYGVYEGITTSGVQLSNCVITGNNLGGVYLTTNSIVVSAVDGCNIDNNTGPGIEIPSTAVAAWCRIMNNNITNNGTYGIIVDAGTTAQNDAAIAFCDYNNVWSNTSGPYHNISAGPHDLNVDPGYAGSGDYTPSNDDLIAAAPVPFA